MYVRRRQSNGVGDNIAPAEPDFRFGKLQRLSFTEACGLIIPLPSRHCQRQCIKACRGSLSDNGFRWGRSTRTGQAQANIFPTAGRRWRFLSSLIIMTADLVVVLVIVLAPPLLLVDPETLAKRSFGIWPQWNDFVTPFIAIQSLLLVFVLAVRGHYSRPVTAWTALVQIYLLSTYAALVSLLASIQTQVPVAYYWLPALWLIVPPAVLAIRCLVNAFLRNAGLEQCCVLSVGTARGLKQIDLAVRSNPIRGYRVVAALDVQASVSPLQTSDSRSSIGLHDGLRRTGANFIFLSLRGCDDQLQSAILAELIRETIPFGVIPDFGDLPIYRCAANAHGSRAPVILIINDRLRYFCARAAKGMFTE